MKFTKMQGIGNDYIYFDCFKNQIQNPEQLSIRLSRRRFSIGSDGIILICPSEVADAKMRIFNADGSEAKMCGNGIRCVGKFLYDKGIVTKTDISVETLSGIKYLHLTLKNQKVAYVTVRMGQAGFKTSDLPMDLPEGEFFNRTLEVAGKKWLGTAVSVGNPHLVISAEDPDSLPLYQIGPLFEKHALFPQGVNTEFIKPTGQNRVKMRVWERGSGETLACGTGACAVASVCVKNGLFGFDRPVTVELAGGCLEITVSPDWQLTMTGPAEIAYEGEVEI